MNKKVIVSTLAISALAVNVFAQGSNLGPNGTANGDASLIIGTNNTTTTNQRINKLGASSAALSGLHPLDFNRNDKASFAISYGHYRNANAVALGAFYRPNERLMIGVGATLGAENQYTINLAIKTGKGPDYIAEAKDAQSRISKLERLVDELTQEVAAQRRI